MKVWNLDTGRIYTAPARVIVARATEYGDWEATCTCGDQLACSSWREAMTWACGHHAFDHQGDPR